MSMSDVKVSSSGRWSRLRGHIFACVALFGIAFAVSINMAGYQRSLSDPSATPYGHDYISFYAAGRLVIEGRPASAYDAEVHHLRQTEIGLAARGMGDDFYYYFGYPPTYLILIIPFAALGYTASVFMFLGTTMALAWFALGRIMGDRLASLAAIAGPGGIVTFIFGQNAFLTTGLIGLALVSLPEQQLLAGVLIGLLGVKPQLGLAFPILLMAGGYWRAFMAAALTVSAMALASVGLFGVDTWTAFLTQASTSHEKLLANSLVGYEKIESLLASLRFYDVPLPIAYAAQALLTLAVAIALTILWRRRSVAFEIRAAAAAAGTLLMTPMCLAYDLTIELVAVGFLYRLAVTTGWLRGEAMLLIFVVASPAIAAFRPEAPWFHAGFIGMVVLFASVMRRAWPVTRPTASPAPAI